MTQETVNPYQSPESDIPIQHPVVDLLTHRKQLVPMWIKVFGWIFIMLGVVAPLGFLHSLYTGEEASFALFGLEASGGEITLTALVIIVLFMAFAVNAYGLLFGRDWGLSPSLVMGYLGLAIAVLVTVSGITSGVFMF